LLLLDQFAERGDLISGVRRCCTKRASNQGKGKAADRRVQHLNLG
jgi:hypothetical protein